MIHTGELKGRVKFVPFSFKPKHTSPLFFERQQSFNMFICSLHLLLGKDCSLQEERAGAPFVGKLG